MVSTETGYTDITAIYDEIAEFLVSSPTAEQIIEFRLSETSEQLISDLLEANRSRGLTSAERGALDEYSRLECLMQAIKVRAFAKLDQEKL